MKEEQSDGYFDLPKEKSLWKFIALFYTYLSLICFMNAYKWWQVSTAKALKVEPFPFGSYSIQLNHPWVELYYVLAGMLFVVSAVGILKRKGRLLGRGVIGYGLMAMAQSSP